MQDTKHDKAVANNPNESEFLQHAVNEALLRAAEIAAKRYVEGGDAANLLAASSAYRAAMAL